MKSGVSDAILILVLVYCLVLCPMYYVGIVQWARDESTVIVESRSFVDKVIDSGELTEDMLADFNITIASLHSKYSVSMVREVEVENPKPDGSGEVYTSYIISEDNKKYNKGDLFTLTVKCEGRSGYMVVARSLFGLDIKDTPVTYTARVRKNYKEG